MVFERRKLFLPFALLEVNHARLSPRARLRIRWLRATGPFRYRQPHAVAARRPRPVSARYPRRPQSSARTAVDFARLAAPRIDRAVHVLVAWILCARSRSGAAFHANSKTASRR